MSINATNKGNAPREIVPAGNHVARAYSMIEVGTVTEDYMGEPKTMKKVRIGFELPTEMRVFSEEKGEQPMVISNEYTLSMHEKAKLRAVLESWRGAAFTEKEAESFDITKLLGKPCMLNVVHKTTANGTYANIGTIAPIPKGLECPPQINPMFVLSYDEWDQDKFESLPKFIKEKMETSQEYHLLFELETPEKTRTETVGEETFADEQNDLPF